MKSTGEVMGIDEDLGCAVAKACMACERTLPLDGSVFVSVCDRDKEAVVPVARAFHELGFRLMATPGTRKALTSAGMPADIVFPRGEGRPNATDVIANEEVQLVINTPSAEAETLEDEKAIRTAAYLRQIPTITTVFGAAIIADAIESVRERGIHVRSMQEFHEAGTTKSAGT